MFEYLDTGYFVSSVNLADFYSILFKARQFTILQYFAFIISISSKLGIK